MRGWKRQRDRDIGRQNWKWVVVWERLFWEWIASCWEVGVDGGGWRPEGEQEAPGHSDSSLLSLEPSIVAPVPMSTLPRQLGISGYSVADPITAPRRNTIFPSQTHRIDCCVRGHIIPGPRCTGVGSFLLAGASPSHGWDSG